MKQRKLLAIDARPLVRGTGGIQRYLAEILPHLIGEEKFEIVLYSDHPVNVKLAFKTAQFRTRSIKSGIARAATWHYWVCKWAAKDQPDIFWSPRHHLPFILPSKTRSVVTIHDFVWKTMPDTMPFLQLFTEKMLMPFSIYRADKIVCSSNTTKKQLLSYYPHAANKSRTVLLGNDTKRAQIIRSLKTEQNYFIAVGTLEPRKNYIRLIKAFEQYAAQGGNKDLVIVGKNGWSFEAIYKQLGLSAYRSRIQIRNNVSDKQLDDLYTNALGFISCSLDEGYGLPPHEATLYGLPLLLADIDVYRELYDHANLWADPYSIDDLTKGLLALAKEKCIAPELIDYQKHHRSWSSCSLKLMDCFDEK